MVTRWKTRHIEYDTRVDSAAVTSNADDTILDGAASTTPAADAAAKVALFDGVVVPLPAAAFALRVKRSANVVRCTRGAMADDAAASAPSGYAATN